MAGKKLPQFSAQEEEVLMLLERVTEAKRISIMVIKLWLTSLQTLFLSLTDTSSRPSIDFNNWGRIMCLGQGGCRGAAYLGYLISYTFF